MSVVPLRPGAPPARPLPPPTGVAQVVGRCCLPDRDGLQFVGAFRLERLVWQDGHASADGVFTGRLLARRGGRARVASRRQAVPVSVAVHDDLVVARAERVEVDLMGLRVRVNAFDVAAPASTVTWARDGLPTAPTPVHALHPVGAGDQRGPRTEQR